MNYLVSEPNKGPAINYREVGQGGLQNGRGWPVKIYPLQKEGDGKRFSDAEGGGGTNYLR